MAAVRIIISGIYWIKLLKFAQNCTYLRQILEMHSCPVVWKEFEPVGPEEVERVLGARCFTTCVLNPYPSWR